VRKCSKPPRASLNASLAEWLTSTGRFRPPYVVSQGTAGQGTVLGRRGRAFITQGSDGSIWVGGGTVTCITGQAMI
jgi:predicted PhzF superfamily epimerase YddE/YHI9